jgi:cytochrome P450
MRPRVEAIVDNLLDQAAARGTMDVIADLAYPLPMTVILEMLGLPAADRDRFKTWSDDFAGILGNALLDETVDRRGQRSVLAAVTYLTQRQDPSSNGLEEGVLSALLAEGKRGDRLDLNELVANTLLLVIGGHETTTNLIGNGLLALLRHPDQLDRLRQEPSLIESAVEELLRYDSPVQYTSRIAPADTVIAECEVRKGTFVGLHIGSANRDPERFDQPDRLDIGRPRNRHLTFARGPHFCLGAALARLEGQIAIREMVRRLPGLRLTGESLEWRPNYLIRGLRALPVVWGIGGDECRSQTRFCRSRRPPSAAL